MSVWASQGFLQVLQGNLPLDHFLLEHLKFGIDGWHVPGSTMNRWLHKSHLWSFGAMEPDCQFCSCYWSHRLLLPSWLFSRITRIQTHLFFMDVKQVCVPSVRALNVRTSSHREPWLAARFQWRNVIPRGLMPFRQTGPSSNFGAF